MADVRIIPLGVGDAFSARHYTTCFALGAGDAWVLIDCPHPVRKRLREASHAAGIPLDLDQVSGVALSHLHADHASGLEDFAYYMHFALGRKARVATHPDVAAKLWTGLLGGGMGEMQADADAPPEAQSFETYFSLTNLDLDRPVPFGPFSIECRKTHHPVPTTAFRVTAQGRVLGFSADSTFDPELIDWLAPADLILHEATSHPRSTVHTPYARLAALPEAYRAKLRLFHYPDDFDADASVIEPLRQGRVYAV